MGRNKEETKVDFSVCRFIKEEMWFFTFDDFFDNKIVIRKMFDNMDRDGKLFYKWYVYANVNISMNAKNAVWDYLNGYPTKLSQFIKK